MMPRRPDIVSLCARCDIQFLKRRSNQIYCGRLCATRNAHDSYRRRHRTMLVIRTQQWRLHTFMRRRRTT